ncbi:MAG: radical SAM protein [Candidatus Saganbacteria bacterium]|nr:radical SAM protein [Candidatus Saganbacteria bacterium]
MTPEEKLKILGTSAKYDISCCGGSYRQAGMVPGIYYASGSNNKIIPILKVLFTNKCKNDCLYCANRISQDMPRVSFTPDELATLFMQIHNKHFVHGLFLSSGVDGSADSTMEKMIKTAKLLRQKHKFRGYIHLKILPGAHPATIRHALYFATRVSVNIECPTPEQLAKIARGKDFMGQIVRAMEVVKNEGERIGQRTEQTTQFIVGAAGESDQQIVKTMSWLRDTKGIFRTYFSAFTPVSQPAPNYNFTTLSIRKHRLYQVEFLQRLYDFSLSEIYFGKEGNLPNHIDPKLNCALHNMDKFPVEINKASFKDLLRIPGIGKTIANKIIAVRQEGRLTYLSQIKKMGALAKKAAPFILINGKKQGEIKDLACFEQLALPYSGGLRQ